MTHSEALKLALDALGKFSIGYHVDAVELNDLIATLEAALVKPESHVSYVCPQCHWSLDRSEQPWVKSYCGGKPNYTLREWRGLTEEEIAEEAGTSKELRDLVGIIEAALKEKNSDQP